MAVIDNAFETKGTHLFFVGSDGMTVRKMTCPTGISQIGGGTADKIPKTCLDTIGRFQEYVAGFTDPQEMSVPFVMYDGDASQADLLVLKKSAEVVGWYVGLSDSTTAPTLASDGLEPPTDRTGFNFNGYVSNVTFDIAINEIVRGTLTIQPSGDTDLLAAV